ncbi:Ulp1 protease [Yasminevirus sp. GU-2018]|uniref:Ulp1 protease n=1 Tax=Yasminevirus sp. GU-2018 TaxID=2420051 RepID=A0A5K0U9C3_9VIRU|nr:Ulp1 protease [Yasminevirus sp. GU-2018]
MNRSTKSTKSATKQDPTANDETETYINDIVSKISSDVDTKGGAGGVGGSVGGANTRCAPGLVYEAGSCARLAVLVEMARAYNKSAPQPDHIRLSNNMETLNPQKYKAYLVDQINKRIGEKCTTQKCWGRQEFVRHMSAKAREEFIKHTHRPDSPQGKFEWLSTFDINDVMAQYYKEATGFKFFGAVPMDFADLPGVELSEANYDNYYKKGITKLGVIFNLDNHDQPGSHWTAMYTDLESGNIFYFDSFGVKPEPRVRALMRQQARFLESKGKNVNTIRVDYNKVQHQKGNSECGVYSINFLVRMARGDNFDKLCNNPVSDKQINKCRSVYFDKFTKKRE